MFRDFSHQLGDDRDVPADVHSHECPSSVLRWFNRVFMKGWFPLKIVISVVSATYVRASMWFVLIVLGLRCTVMLLFMSPRTSHLVAWPQNQWLPGGHMRLSQCFNGPPRALPTLPCPLSEFLLFAQAVLFTCFSFSFLTLCASLSRLPFAACSGWQRVLALVDSSWRKSLVTCAPRLSHVGASLRGKDYVGIFQRRNKGV